MATSWGYLPNTGDRRLASIGNVGLVSGQHSTYQYTTTPEDFISAITETSDSAPVYPSPGTQSASYNNLNQLTNLSGQSLTWDADGNLLSDGQRDYTWDAENRLIGITYPAQPGKATSFAYDGLGRRTSISSTPPGGGSAVTLSYLWCGARICQARDSGNNVTREYYSEGELVPGAPPQTYFYGPDQIGSVRRVFETATSAPAFSYDPYGNALQATAPATDFGYAGMFYNPDSGLYLTQYRAYDPVAGRWLSRDPLGEASDLEANLYAYVENNPIFATDPEGSLKGLPPNPPMPDFGDCDVQLENDLARCNGMNCSKQAQAACIGQAYQRYAACLRGRRGSDLPPPYVPRTVPLPSAPPPWWLPLILLPFFFGVPA